MKFTIALLLALCVSCTTVHVPPTVVAVAADCAAPAVRDLAVHLLDDVTSALLVTGDWRIALAAVAARAGNDGLAAVKCAVAEILGQTKAQLASKASMSPATAVRTQTLHDRALAWTSEHP